LENTPQTQVKSSILA